MSAAIELVHDGPITPLTRRAFHVLIDNGLFDEDEKIELLEGVLVPMTPQGGHHSKTIARLNTRLVPALLGRAVVFSQSPFAASTISEPEPDLFITGVDLDEDDDNPSQAYCVIEVAMTSQRRDRRKLPIYATANVRQYILIDLPARTARVCRGPNGADYDREETVREGTPIVIDAFPDVAFDLAEILPKA